MSRLRQWLRNDLSKVNKPVEVGRTVRRWPMILVMSVLNFVIALVVIYLVLALFGHTDAFANWWFLAGIWAGSSGGRMISKRKAGVAASTDGVAQGSSEGPPVSP